MAVPKRIKNTVHKLASEYVEVFNKVPTFQELMQYMEFKRMLLSELIKDESLLEKFSKVNR